MVVTVVALPAENVVTPPDCRYEPLGSGTVDKILDGRTVISRQRPRVRIAGIEVPGGTPDWPPEPRSCAVAEAEVILKPFVFDRYGRLVPRQVVREAPNSRGAQALLAAGHAWSGPTCSLPVAKTGPGAPRVALSLALSVVL